MITLDLPAPMEMRGRWAAFAALMAVKGWARGCNADGPRWHYDDAGGNWADLVWVDDDRAVLFGHDHEYSETYFRKAAEYFEEPETDLLAGAPDWWAPPVEAAMAQDNWVGFIYGFDNGWTRAEYDLEDGFRSVNLPALSDEESRELAVEFAKDAPGHVWTRPDPKAFDAMIAADTAITEPMIRAFIGPVGWDPAAGVAAAAAFLR